MSSSQGGYVYEMKPLRFDDSKKLFFKRAFGSENSHYPYLEDVPDRILRKCDGLPLAIITVASMLTDQHAKEEWDMVLNSIGSKLSKRPDAEKMTSILSLSYTNIPHHLRTCLLYLSLFPEDYEIEKQCLINRWIAEGFIQKEQERSAYETGERYFNELINRCMIQPVNVKYDQANACRVHDIILDYIKCKAADENFVASLDASEDDSTSKHSVRRLCVNNQNGKNATICTGLTLSQVRSFSILGKPVQIFLGSLTTLRVLDLGGCGEIEDRHLAGIEKLFHLKYLRLTSKSITKLPEKIGELQYLQTLDVLKTNIRELPLTVTKLQRLARLYVYWHATVPDGMIGQMHSLVELSSYVVESYEQMKSLQEFSKLKKLRTLKINWQLDLPNDSEGKRQSEDIHNILGFLLSSCNVHNLYIADASERLFPMPLDSLHLDGPCSLRKLYFAYRAICKAPNWMCSLGNLQVLELEIFCVRPEDVEILGAIPSLLILELGTTGGVDGWITIQGSNDFRSLKYFSLGISYCGTTLEFEAGAMPKLEHVKFQFPGRKMECLDDASIFGIHHLLALTKVEVKIDGVCYDCCSYDWPTHTKDGIIECVADAINAAVETHPNRPTLSFEVVRGFGTGHFEDALRRWNQLLHGALTEWLTIWHIEEQTEQEQEVSKGKLGDTLTSLQQLASPTGRKDTASVLYEVIKYIKFLHDQVDALSAPCQKNRQRVPQLKVPKDDGGEPEQGDLTGRGLCLVPISSTFAEDSETLGLAPVDFW